VSQVSKYICDSTHEKGPLRAGNENLVISTIGKMELSAIVSNIN